MIYENYKYTKMPISDMYDIIDINENPPKNEKELYIQTHYNCNTMTMELIQVRLPKAVIKDINLYSSQLTD